MNNMQASNELSARQPVPNKLIESPGDVSCPDSKSRLHHALHAMLGSRISNHQKDVLATTSSAHTGMNSHFKIMCFGTMRTSVRDRLPSKTHGISGMLLALNNQHAVACARTTFAFCW